VGSTSAPDPYVRTGFADLVIVEERIMASFGRIGRLGLLLACATASIASAQDTPSAREARAREERARDRQTEARKDAAEQLKESQERAREATKSEQERSREALKGSQERSREALEDKQKTKRERTEEQQARARDAKEERAEDQQDRTERQQDAARDGQGMTAFESARKQPQADLWSSRRASSWKVDQRNWGNRGGYIGYRVPSDKFSTYYGPTHGFRMQSLPWRMVDDRPRFNFGGKSFSLVDRYPEYWPASWYHADDVYLTEERGGYYLVNRRFPNDRVAVEIYDN
jgi:hypothetical protein